MRALHNRFGPEVGLKGYLEMKSGDEFRCELRYGVEGDYVEGVYRVK